MKRIVLSLLGLAACESNVLVETAVTDLAVYDGNVYWCDGHDIRRIPVGGGESATELVASTPGRRDRSCRLSVVDGTVYWATMDGGSSAGILAASVDRGEVMTLIADRFAERPYVANGDIYWVNIQQGLKRAPLTNVATAGQAIARTTVSGIQRVGDSLVYADKGDSSLYRIPATGGAAELLVDYNELRDKFGLYEDKGQAPYGIAVVGDDLYWIAIGIVGHRDSNGRIEILATGDWAMGSIAVDERTIYFADRLRGGVYGLPRAPGSRVATLAGEGSANRHAALAIDDAQVYYGSDEGLVALPKL